MKVEKINEGTAHQMIKVTDIEGDMGEDTDLQLLQQPDGDVIVTIKKLCEEPVSIEFCSGHGGGRRPFIAKKLRELIAELEIWTSPPKLKISECTEGSPCCDRRGEYNGFSSGPLNFECPKHCMCHD